MKEALDWIRAHVQADALGCAAFGIRTAEHIVVVAFSQYEVNLQRTDEELTRLLEMKLNNAFQSLSAVERGAIR